MNKRYYSFGNPFKVLLREHSCYKCGAKLVITKHYKVVSQKSEEAKYYDFSVGIDGGTMIGACEFVHRVFYCSNCRENIEFVTQINQEDIDIIIKKVKDYFDKSGKKFLIKKCYENEHNIIAESIKEINLIKNLCIVVEEDEKPTLFYRIPISRKKCWERPYYFKLTKKELIYFIKQINN